MAEAQKKHSTKETKERSQKNLLASRSSIWLLGIGIFLVLVGLLVAYGVYYQNRFLPRTYIGDLEVSGLTSEEARQVSLQARERYQVAQVTFYTSEVESSTQLAGVVVDVDAALTQLWSEQHQEDWWNVLGKYVTAPFLASRVDPTVTLDEPVFRGLLKSFETNHKEASIAISGQTVTTVPGEAGVRVNLQEVANTLSRAFPNVVRVSVTPESFEPELLASELEPLRQQIETILAKPWSVKLSSDQTASLSVEQLGTVLATELQQNTESNAVSRQLVIKDDVLTEIVTTWGAAVNKEAVNARLSWQNSQVVVAAEGSEGRALDIAATKEALTKALTRTTPSYTAEAVMTITKPAVRAETLASLGLTQRIGVASTDFSGSPQNRAYNIKLGQRNLDRTLVSPGEIYSTIDKLGPIDESAGFLAELVIKNNRTIPEAGGGLCQVSTTLFRAVLNAGLPITERQNHSYRVSYYERGVGPGLDATIYSPKPDFRWKNDLGSSVYIQSAVQGETITFELYGTGDGRSSTISAPQILEETPAPEPIYSQTDQLYVGEEKQLERARSGMKTVVTYTVVRDGKEINRQDFRSTYRPWAAQYLVGTKQRETATPAPTTSPESTPSPTVVPAP